MEVVMPIAELSASKGGLLRILRATQNISQLQLAKRTGIPQSTICQIENDFAKPTVDQLTRIWAALST